MITVLTGDLVNSTKMSNETYSGVINSLNALLNDDMKIKYQWTN